jgi:hypothetical protein
MLGYWIFVSQRPPFFTPKVSDIIDNEVFNVPPAGIVQRNITVPAYLTFTQLYGSFSVQDGNNNTIRVYVMDSQNFAEWQKGHNSTRLYDSNEVNSDEFDLFSLATDKTYHVVFDNTYSVKPKTVNATVLLYYLPG